MAEGGGEVYEGMLRQGGVEKTEGFMNTMFIGVMFIYVLVMAFFVFLAVKLSGKKDWGSE